MARQTFLSSFLLLTIGVLSVQAQPPSVPQTRVAHSRTGSRLTPPSSASPLEVLSAYLRAHGHSDQTVQSTVVVSQARDEASSITHLRLEQRSGTLPVYGVYVKAAVSPLGELISVIENLVAVPAASAVQAQVGSAAALGAALRHLYGDTVAPPGLARREGETDVFMRTAFFHKEPRVTPVAIPRGDGLLAVAFLVETWSQRRNLLHHTLIGGGGEVLGVQDRTANDSYNVFTIYPGASPQTVEPGVPGWLFGGNHTSTNIAGNNVHAYLDTDADNAPDAGGTTVSDGNFLAVADLDTAPTATANRDVSVQNLFYLNNVIHDTLLGYGFTEAEGNFQETNTSGQGAGSDSVNAEAQDGSGTDNANFATPSDGSNPRMQMYLWTGFGTHQVVVGPATYTAQGAAFGPSLDTTGLSGELALGGGTGNQACSRLPRQSLLDMIAIVDRGNCDFTVKVRNVQAAGARAVIVVNNVAGLPFTMGGSARTTIPAVMVSQSDGAAIKAAVSSTATVRMNEQVPLMRDSALDSDIVWHEYGHGLTWRMIGGMSGVMAGAIGEGMSDVLAVIINNDDKVAEYSGSDPAGIRTEPYASYSRTYGDFSSSEVHFDGEIYGAIGWRLFQNFGAARDPLLRYLVDGMRYTPATPTFEQMRDGILASVDALDLPDEAADACRIWDAFADYGVGVGATATLSRGGRLATISESFSLPAGCTALP